MNKQHTNLMYSALIAGALIGSFFSPYVSVANGQSPMDPMSMMDGDGYNETDMSQNMSMPQLNMGVVTMPVVCTSLDEILGSIGGMTGGGGGDNETQDQVMGMLQKMMSGGGLDGMDNNMTEADMQEMQQAMNMTEGVDLQKVMNMQLCSLMTDEKMMEKMMMKK